MLAVLPHGWGYFRKWRTLRWFLLFLVPGVGSSVVMWLRGHGFWQAVLLMLINLAVAIVIFVACCSGMISSNIGTYFRDTEPVRFWGEVAFLGVAYAALCCVGYFWH